MEQGNVGGRDGLRAHGITINGSWRNLSSPALYEQAIQPRWRVAEEKE